MASLYSANGHAVNGNGTAKTTRLSKLERAQIVADVHAGRTALADIASTKAKLCAFADVSPAYVGVVGHRNKPTTKPISDRAIEHFIDRAGLARIWLAIGKRTSPMRDTAE